MKKIYATILIVATLFAILPTAAVHAKEVTIPASEDFPYAVTYPTYLGEVEVPFELDYAPPFANELGIGICPAIELPKDGEPLFILGEPGSVMATIIYTDYENGDDVFYYYSSVEAVSVDENCQGRITREYEAIQGHPCVFQVALIKDSHGYDFTFLVGTAEQLSKLKVAGAAGVSNSGDVSVTFMGKDLQFDLPVINKNGRTFYPFRQLIEAVGGNVQWDPATSTAIAELNGNKVEFTVGCYKYIVNGEEKTMDAGVVTFIENGRTYLPVRYACEGLGFEVEWNASTNTIIIK